jgi:hypothetical protein
MMREGFELQGKNELARFSAKVNDLLASRFIISDKRIAALLKCVVSTPQLTDCIKKTNRDFSYAGEFARNRVVLYEGENGYIRSRLSLPVDKGRLFTFVFCLLAEFDSRRRDLSKFLGEYYFDEDINVSFEKFCDEIVRPFKKAGEHILREIDPESLDAEMLEQGEGFFKAERVYISTLSYDKTVDLLNLFAKKLHGGDILATAQEKVEAAETAEALIYAIMSKNPKLIRLMWLAFKNSCGKLKGGEKSVTEVERELAAANLV